MRCACKGSILHIMSECIEPGDFLPPQPASPYRPYALDALEGEEHIRDSKGAVIHADHRAVVSQAWEMFMEVMAADIIEQLYRNNQGDIEAKQRRVRDLAGNAMILCCEAVTAGVKALDSVALKEKTKGMIDRAQLDADERLDRLAERMMEEDGA